MTDEIIKELWEIKDGIARKYDYNIDALIDHLKTNNQVKGRKIVDLSILKKDPGHIIPGLYFFSLSDKILADSDLSSSELPLSKPSSAARIIDLSFLKKLSR